MCSRAGLSGEQRRALNGLDLGDGGTRRRNARASGPDGVATSSSLSACTATGSDEPRRFAQPVEQRPIVGARKLASPDEHMNALKPDDPVGGHACHVADVAGHQSAPQREVGDGRRFERRALAVEVRRRDGAGRRVERHVEEQRAAAGRQRAAAGGRSFPFGAARLVEVDVDVDEPGQDEQTRGVESRCRPPAESSARWRRCGRPR